MLASATNWDDQRDAREGALCPQNILPVHLPIVSKCGEASHAAMAGAS